ncbi:MAG TPA: twin-arginine translocase TatA/TatE family subunit [Gemmatimonadaceae bacterium]|nr:twin-arginine translocase TatA/TatE family subunit [Gemmatimonadaceae bacterium]
MGFLAPDKLFFLFLIVLLLFGAKRLPEIGGSIGKGIREFKKNISDVERHLAEPEPEVRPAERLNAGERSVTPTPSEAARPEPKRLI